MYVRLIVAESKWRYVYANMGLCVYNLALAAAQCRIDVFCSLRPGCQQQDAQSGTASENGRARKIVAESRTFDTLKQAMLELNISEYKLHSRLKDPANKEYYYL